MENNSKNLKEMIVQKNIILRSASKSDTLSDERIRQLQNELDKLLYQYYKSIKRNNTV